MPKTPDPAETKKQIEAMVGRELDLTPEQVLSFSFPIGAHDITNGTVASRTITIPPAKICTPSPLLDASGAASTGPAGNITFLLSTVICAPGAIYAEPVNLLATAHSNSPFYVTTAHAIVGGGTDVQITLFAWDHTGKPAPNVSVHWRCRVVSHLG